MDWRVIDFKPHAKGTLRGFFSLQVGDLLFKGFSLHKKEETGARWIGVPQREYMENGERKFAPQVEFIAKERKYDFQRWALQQIDALLLNEVNKETAIPAKPRRLRIDGHELRIG